MEEKERLLARPMSETEVQLVSWVKRMTLVFHKLVRVCSTIYQVLTWYISCIWFPKINYTASIKIHFHKKKLCLYTKTERRLLMFWIPWKWFQYVFKSGGDPIQNMIMIIISSSALAHTRLGSLCNK